MNMTAEELIAELKEADATLNSDNYKSWSQVRLAIASAINYLTPKEPEAVHGNEAEKEVCQCISIIGLIKGPNGEKICKSCKKIRADHW